MTNRKQLTDNQMSGISPEIEAVGCTTFAVLFALDQMEENYMDEAWRVFLSATGKSLLAGSDLYQCVYTDSENRRLFCIASSGDHIDSSDPEIAFHRMNAASNGVHALLQIDRSNIARLPLSLVGSVDAVGRFVERCWSKQFHYRCLLSNMGYAPLSRCRFEH